MARQGFALQVSNLHALSLPDLWWWETNIFDCYEIVVLKSDKRWHGSDKACTSDICGRPFH